MAGTAQPSSAMVIPKLDASSVHGLVGCHSSTGGVGQGNFHGWVELDLAPVGAEGVEWGDGQHRGTTTKLVFANDILTAGLNKTCKEMLWPIVILVVD